MPMTPFSSEHLQILDHLPEEALPRQRDAGRFMVIGEPVMVDAARRAARKRRGWRSPVEDADALTLAHIYIRVLDGRYSELESDAAKERRILADIDNCVRAAVGREARRRRRFAPLGAHTDTLPAGDPDYLAREARLERVDAELKAICGLDASAVDRLLLLLLIHPAYAERADVEAAVAASSVSHRNGALRYTGLTRSVDETLLLIERCVQVPLSPAELRSSRAERRAVRRRLAWTLRGPGGALDRSVWSAADWLRAENWLDKRRAAAMENLVSHR